MNDFVDLSSGLSADYEKLYESGRYTDVSIHIGKEPGSKIFFAHTLVLCTRSKLFENSLTGSAESPDEIQKTPITFEDVTPDIFEILLRYIYTGRMSYDACKNVGWVRLMDGAGKFKLLDLLAAIETWLIDKQKEWIQHNIFTVYKYAASAPSLNRLLDYCNQIMISHPEIVFTSNDFATLPKETLITLLKSDDLDMEEDDVWMSVIQWATGQVPELKLGNDPNDWSSNDISTVKDIIADFIPHIRVFSITPNKVVQYRELFPRKLCFDLLNYHMDKSYKPVTCILPSRKHNINIDSVIINKKHAEWLLSKVVESKTRLQLNQRASMKRDITHKLTLLYRQSRDGNMVEKFRELCNGKGPTIAVGKVSNTEEILGGYNPVAWTSKNGHINTKESFVFTLDKNVNNSIVSFVVDNSHAIWDYGFPVFGCNKTCDLHFGNDTGAKPYAKKDVYQNPIRHSSDRFGWTDWEVFLVEE